MAKPSRHLALALALTTAGTATGAVLIAAHALSLWHGRFAGAGAVAAGMGIGSITVECVFKLADFVCELGGRALTARDK